jgi:hypothetical protein
MIQNMPVNEKEAAKIIGLSVHWLRRKRWEGGGPKFVKMGSGQRAAVRYLIEDLQDYISSHRVTSTSSATE